MGRMIHNTGVANSQAEKPPRGSSFRSFFRVVSAFLCGIVTGSLVIFFLDVLLILETNNTMLAENAFYT